jgi:Ser/Thr protein kinase RdoA (MazF antagonist)
MPLLRPADADLVRRECGLPDLALLLDSDRLAARLEQTLGRYSVDAVAVRYLRYKPGQACVASCRASVNGQQVDFVARAYRPGAVDKFRKAMARASVPGPVGPGRFVLHDSTVLITVFPNDGRLEPLARLASSESLAELAARLGERPRAAVRLETLRHNPERRFVGRLIVDEKATATVRCYTRQDFTGIAAKAGALTSRGPLRLARRLTRRTRWRLLAFEWLHGRLLDDVIRQRTAPASALRVVGAALAHLHGQEGHGLPRRTGTSEARALVALARQLAFLHPPIAARVGNLAERMAACLVAQTVSARPLHGDFYAKQVLLDGETAAFIDLDEASLGDPAIDLARFRADLEATVASGRLDAGEIEPLVEPLLDGYRQTSGGLPASLNLHIAAQLLRVAAHPFRRREPSWPDLAVAIVERAERFLDRNARLGPRKRSASLTVVDPFGVTRDPLMPFLVQALDPNEMSSRLTRDLNCLSAGEHIQVFGISVTRHKPGRRCLVAYDLAVHHPSGTVRELAVVGKTRARGTDTSTHDLLKRLWAGSFGTSADDEILVPEPLGIVTDVHMSVQRRVPGEPLTRLLEGPAGDRLARRAADAIHKLHSVPASSRRRHTVEDEMRILGAGLTAVVRDHPRWRKRIARLFHGCMRLAVRIPEEPLSGIHRDFYPDQVLVDGERLYLTDLDLYATGAPALDVGNFVAHVEEHSLRHFGDPNHLQDRSEALVERYLQLSRRTSREAIRAWTTLSLARQVAISRLTAERQPFTAALLDLCERRLACGEQKGAQQ